MLVLRPPPLSPAPACPCPVPATRWNKSELPPHLLRPRPAIRRRAQRLAARGGGRPACVRPAHAHTAPPVLKSSEHQGRGLVGRLVLREHAQPGAAQPPPCTLYRGRAALIAGERPAPLKPPGRHPQAARGHRGPRRRRENAASERAPGRAGAAVPAPRPRGVASRGRPGGAAGPVGRARAGPVIRQHRVSLDARATHP
jgi:hypothetical protein